jgi:hypothetical protein
MIFPGVVTVDSSAIRILWCQGPRNGCSPLFFAVLSGTSVVRDFPPAFTTEGAEATEESKNEMELRRLHLVHGHFFAGQLSAGNKYSLWSFSVNSVRSVVNDFLEGSQHRGQGAAEGTWIAL